MYFPRLYITCLTLLLNLLERERERGITYCNNIETINLDSDLGTQAQSHQRLMNK